MMRDWAHYTAIIFSLALGVLWLIVVMATSPIKADNNKKEDDMNWKRTPFLPVIIRCSIHRHNADFCDWKQKKILCFVLPSVASIFRFGGVRPFQAVWFIEKKRQETTKGGAPFDSSKPKKNQIEWNGTRRKMQPKKKRISKTTTTTTTTTTSATWTRNRWPNAGGSVTWRAFTIFLLRRLPSPSSSSSSSSSSTSSSSSSSSSSSFYFPRSFLSRSIMPSAPLQLFSPPRLERGGKAWPPYSSVAS